MRRVNKSMRSIERGQRWEALCSLPEPAKLPSVQTLARFGEYFYLRAWLVFGERMVRSFDPIASCILISGDMLTADARQAKVEEVR